MIKSDSTTNSRALYIGVCSGKGGVGKSTISLMLAARLAQSGKRTLLIDTDFGVGDIATLGNIVIKHGLESLLSGELEINEVAAKVAPRFWVIGSKPGSYLSPAAINPTSLTNCKTIDSHFDVVIIDTASTIEPLTIALISATDITLTVITPQVSAVADSYIQLKRIIEIGSANNHTLLINRTGSEVAGRQTCERFTELVEKFLSCKLTLLGIFADDPLVELATEHQTILQLTREENKINRSFSEAVNVLNNMNLDRIMKTPSYWTRLGSVRMLKFIGVFDDREMVLSHVSGGGRRVMSRTAVTERHEDI